jgi:hypothetical protein
MMKYSRGKGLRMVKRMIQKLQQNCRYNPLKSFEAIDGCTFPIEHVYHDSRFESMYSEAGTAHLPQPTPSA